MLFGCTVFWDMHLFPNLIEGNPVRDILRDGTARNTFRQPACAGCEDEAGKKAKPPSYTKLVWYVKYLQKVLESLTGPADFESNFWGSPK